MDMGIFSSIKDAIFGKAEAQEASEAAPAPVAAGTPAHQEAESVTVVDVEATLDAMEGANALNWHTSIVDLMKLVGLDASYANRKELAGEMGDADYSGTAEENIWMHKQVMIRLANNGGKVPASLRD